MKTSNIKPLDEWLTVEQCAKETKSHHATIRRCIKSGRLRHARLGSKAIRVRRDWLNTWLEASGTPVEVSR